MLTTKNKNKNKNKNKTRIEVEIAREMTNQKFLGGVRENKKKKYKGLQDTNTFFFVFSRITRKGCDDAFNDMIKGKF